MRNQDQIRCTPASASHSALTLEVRRWQRFQLALEEAARKGDLDSLREINRKLIKVLGQCSAPSSGAEQQAKQKLAASHRQIINRLQLDKAQLAQTLASFRVQQDGLAAYHLTSISAGDSQVEFESTGTVNEYGN